MTSSFYKTFATVLLIGFSVLAFAQDGISFYEGTWEKVLAEAKAKNKPVFVDCYASWCVPCKMLEKEVFPDQAVGSFYNDQFINYRIDMEKGEGPELASRYGVRAYPTLLYVDASGNLLHQVVGKLDVPDFITTGKTALDPSNRLAQLDKQFADGERSAEFITRYASVLEEAGKDEKASEAVEAFMASKSGRQVMEKENWELINHYVRNVSGATFQNVWNNRAVFKKEFGEESVTQYLYNTAVDGAKTAGKENNTELLNKTLIPVIEASSTTENKDRNVLMAKKIFYKSAKDWNKYAETAAQYIAAGYHKPQTKKTRELEESLAKKNTTYEEYVKSTEANALNGEAWTFYEHVDDKEMLKTALGWIEASVALKKQYYNLDTHAALLFKLGQTAKAKKIASEAIAQAEQEGLDPSSTKEMVEKYAGNVE